ncbi:MAG: hypothetical protein LC640_08635 [Frankia sp.]|nr:hypothetical protein [Frankia sp.]
MRRVGVPALIFANKIDRPGARDDALLDEIRARLATAVVPMGSVTETGTKRASVVPGCRGAALHDARAIPVFFGSALTGAGIDALIAGIAELWPALEPDRKGPASGVAFKVERSASGEKVAYVRMFAGELRTRERVHFGRGGDGKVTALDVFAPGAATRPSSVSAGQIAKVWGLAEIQVGDVVGVAPARAVDPQFPPPTLEAVVVPRDAAHGGALRAALAQLADQDPLINVHQADDQISLSLYGEVQREVIAATLADDFGLSVGFHESTTICLERPTGTGEALEVLQSEAHPYSATVGLRVEPALPGSGFAFRLDVNPRDVPLYIYKTRDNFVAAMTDYVARSLHEGRYGWPVSDCVVTMQACGYYIGDGPAKPVSATTRTTAADFRKLTPIVVTTALSRAGTAVCEPMMRVAVEAPTDTLGTVIASVARLGGTAEAPVVQGDLATTRTRLPAARLQHLRRMLPGLTQGEGVVEAEFDGYEPVTGQPPIRGRRPGGARG